MSENLSVPNSSRSSVLATKARGTDKNKGAHNRNDAAKDDCCYNLRLQVLYLVGFNTVNFCERVKAVRIFGPLNEQVIFCSRTEDGVDKETDWKDPLEECIDELIVAPPTAFAWNEFYAAAAITATHYTKHLKYCKSAEANNRYGPWHSFLILIITVCHLLLNLAQIIEDTDSIYNTFIAGRVKSYCRPCHQIIN